MNRHARPNKPNKPNKSVVVLSGSLECLDLLDCYCRYLRDSECRGLFGIKLFYSPIKEYCYTFMDEYKIPFGTSVSFEGDIIIIEIGDNPKNYLRFDLCEIEQQIRQELRKKGRL